jgi:hypothetical protein
MVWVQMAAWLKHVAQINCSVHFALYHQLVQDLAAVQPLV